MVVPPRCYSKNTGTLLLIPRHLVQCEEPRMQCCLDHSVPGMTQTIPKELRDLKGCSQRCLGGHLTSGTELELSACKSSDFFPSTIFLAFWSSINDTKQFFSRWGDSLFILRTSNSSSYFTSLSCLSWIWFCVEKEIRSVLAHGQSWYVKKDEQT